MGTRNRLERRLRRYVFSILHDLNGTNEKTECVTLWKKHSLHLKMFMQRNPVFFDVCICEKYMMALSIGLPMDVLSHGNDINYILLWLQVFKKGKIKRADVWITAKLWIKDAAPKHVEAALVESLRKLKVAIHR